VGQVVRLGPLLFARGRQFGGDKQGNEAVEINLSKPISVLLEAQRFYQALISHPLCQSFE
jgi:hypothetical protein